MNCKTIVKGHWKLRFWMLLKMTNLYQFHHTLIYTWCFKLNSRWKKVPLLKAKNNKEARQGSQRASQIPLVFTVIKNQSQNKHWWKGCIISWWHCLKVTQTKNLFFLFFSYNFCCVKNLSHNTKCTKIDPANQSSDSKIKTGLHEVTSPKFLPT